MIPIEAQENSNRTEPYVHLHRPSILIRNEPQEDSNDREPYLNLRRPATLIPNEPQENNNNVFSMPLRTPTQIPAGEDDCDQVTDLGLNSENNGSPNRASLEIFNRTATEAIENEIRAARQVISESTRQRNVVLEFLLHLQTAQRELANEAELVTRQLPALRVRPEESGSNNTTQGSGVISQGSTLPSVNPVQISVLSRLTRLSQRTREVMEDLDRRRNAVGMSSLSNQNENNCRADNDESYDDEDQSDQKDRSGRIHLLRPMRKVRMEERLLVEWSPDDDYDEFKLESGGQINFMPLNSPDSKQFSQSDGRELTSR